MTICLTMIVKDESDVIRRCLESVIPFIDTWCIVDTGSIDDTMSIIRDVMKDIPGKLHERKWVDFAYNRTESIELAETEADYLFIIDADEVLQLDKSKPFPVLNRQGYLANIIFDNITYSRLCLISTKHDWHFEGVIHEYLECDVPYTSVIIDGFSVIVNTDGARSKNPNKFRDDAIVLRNALIKEPNNTRYMFYLAQSLRDSGDSEAALYEYRNRSQHKGWDEEDWYSLYQMGNMAQRCEHESSNIIEYYLNAYNDRPERVESIFWLGNYLHRLGKYKSASIFLKLACNMPESTDALFVEHDVYKWMRFDMLALTYSRLHKNQKAKDIWQELLDKNVLPASEIKRVKSNILFCPT